jgi:ring-1,2-phenylacetyl-CoA epoxidase subunit PaaE
MAAASARPGRGFHKLEVAAVDRLTDEAVTITFRVPEPLRPAYGFAAGQHLALRLPAGGPGGGSGGGPSGVGGVEDRAPAGEVRRTYSVCQPQDPSPELLRVAVKRVPGGAFSDWATTRLAAGDRLEVMTPAGRFTAVPGARRHAAVVGGSGITPVLSIVSTVLRDDPSVEFLVLRSEQSTASVMFLEELQDLKDRHPGRLQLVHLLSREPRQAGPDSGRPDAERLAGMLPALVRVGSVDAWYLCGPYGLIRAAESALRTLGVPRRRVHEEVFHLDEIPEERPDAEPAGRAPEGGCEVTAVLDGLTTVFRTDGADRLLDGLLKHRQDAPFACKGGVCGTCRARLLTGEVRMDRNFALEPEEVAAGYVLTCQSHPVTPVVHVDYDG